jgi:hypothetical protein
MSVSNDSTELSTVEDGRALLSSAFLEFCVKVRNNDPSILPELGNGKSFNIRHLSEKEDIELADALLQNTNVTYLEFVSKKHTNSSAEAMAKYVPTSKSLQRIRWNGDLRQRVEMICFFLHAFQESTSLKEPHVHFPVIDGPSSLALENMLTNTQSLRSLSFICRAGEEIDVAAVQSGLKKNTTLRELTLESSASAMNISPLLTSVRDHPLLRRLS